MPTIGRKTYKFNVENKSQDDGDQTIDTSKTIRDPNLVMREWQIQATVSSTPTAGTLAVKVKTPGATAAQQIGGSIDLTGSDLIKTFYAAAEQIILSPSDLDTDKTYSAYLFASK